MSTCFDPDTGLLLREMQRNTHTHKHTQNNNKPLMPSELQASGLRGDTIHPQLINTSITFGKRQGVLMNTLGILMGNSSGRASQRRRGRRRKTTAKEQESKFKRPLRAAEQH